ncbi:hypothetical protein MKX01_025229 [Papaver californicum]|nr:hypothetical protein MKX01_025229 [Papaver californicum]
MSVFYLGKNAAGSEVGVMFQSDCPNIDKLRSVITSITTLAAREVNYLSCFNVINNLVAVVRNILAWEAVSAIHSLERTASVATNQVKESPGEKSQEKNKVVLGKRTVVIKQLLKDKLKIGGDPALLNEWVHDLSLFFEPKVAELDTFFKKAKEMVESNESRLLKVPKGTRDFSKEQMAIRERAFKIIEEVFKRHGRWPLILQRVMFIMFLQGGELCSLRYDLTVPFARYVAMDNPSKGRFREFYQCDFDIIGQYCAIMVPDFEVVKVLTELLDELNIGDYEIKLNHRKLLDAMLEICGVPPEKFGTICSSIDKLDKLPFEPNIKKEMVEEKGLTAEVADKIGALVKKCGPPLELLSEFKQDNQCIEKVVLDLSLARGLDYYTGVIFEAVLKGSKVGSIAAGGRYDNLIGMFGMNQVPAVGVSLGIERVFYIMEQQLKNDANHSIRATETEVLVSIFGDDKRQAVKLASELWGAKIKAEYMVDKNVRKHMKQANDSRILLMVIVGDQERRANQVRIKDMQAHKEELVDRDSVVEEVQRRLNLLSLQ